MAIAGRAEDTGSFAGRWIGERARCKRRTETAADDVFCDDYDETQL